MVNTTVTSFLVIFFPKEIASLVPHVLNKVPS